MEGLRNYAIAEYASCIVCLRLKVLSTLEIDNIWFNTALLIRILSYEQ